MKSQSSNGILETMIKDSFKAIFTGKQRVMVVGAHPDDVEVFAAGTISRLVASGITVRVIKMTSGGRGSKATKFKTGELVKKRETEDTASMQLLGIKPEDNVYLRINDGEIENDLSTISKLAHQIRLFKPDLVITHNPDDIIAQRKEGLSRVNHRDHRHTAQSLIDAVYPYGRDISSFPEHFKDPQASIHNVLEVMLADSHDHPQEIFIDITSFMDQRQQAISCHQSQFNQEAIERVTYNVPRKVGHRYYERFRYAKIR